MGVKSGVKPASRQGVMRNAQDVTLLMSSSSAIVHERSSLTSTSAAR